MGKKKIDTTNPESNPNPAPKGRRKLKELDTADTSTSDQAAGESQPAVPARDSVEDVWAAVIRADLTKEETDAVIKAADAAQSPSWDRFVVEYIGEACRMRRAYAAGARDRKQQMNAYGRMFLHGLAHGLQAMNLANAIAGTPWSHTELLSGHKAGMKIILNADLGSLEALGAASLRDTTCVERWSQTDPALLKQLFVTVDLLAATWDAVIGSPRPEPRLSDAVRIGEWLITFGTIGLLLICRVGGAVYNTECDAHIRAYVGSLRNFPGTGKEARLMTDLTTWLQNTRSR